MNSIQGQLAGTLRALRWGLPWLGAVAISSSVAYAVTAGLGSAPVTQVAESVAVEARLSPATAALADGDDVRARLLSGTVADLSGNACDSTGNRLQYVGGDEWIPVGGQPRRCPAAGW
jgi:hypothetical protein